jgi:4-hydroxy 2-oxovalerate aldolase
MNALPVTHIEVGYRNNPQKDYLGKFGYCPEYVLKNLRERLNKKLLVMVNEKSSTPADVARLIDPISDYIDMVRLAVDPKNIHRALHLAEAIKARGKGVGMNVMYMSKWTESKDFIKVLSSVNDVTDVFCMVDSYGGVSPDELTTIYSEVKTRVTVPIGFHGHNNLQLALINTLTALKLGVEYVDATVLGMGRGAGNLNLELLLTYLNRNNGLDVDFNVLGEAVSAFTPLHKKYNWGTNLPYMLSGTNSLPQKDVMDWVSNRVYTFNSIVRALDNKRKHIADNAKFPIFKNDSKFDKTIVVGGGDSVYEHIDGIKNYINSYNKVSVVFATARHAALFNDVDCEKFFVVVGAEGRRLERVLDMQSFKDTVILPPYPRPMGTEVPRKVVTSTYELDQISFVKGYNDSCTAVALQIALNVCAPSDIVIAGYDGYAGGILSEKEAALTVENRTIFNAFKTVNDGKFAISLMPSLYKELEVVSVYQNL